MPEVYINGKPVPFPRESPNVTPDRDREQPRFIVLHSTIGGFAGAVSWLMNKVSRASAHFVISKKGEIRQLVSLKKNAWHAGRARYGNPPRTNMNACSIGIEMEHFDRQGEEWPPAQLDAVIALCKWLRHMYSIPAEKIVGHFEIAWPRGRKRDPMGFPWAELRERVQ